MFEVGWKKSPGGFECGMTGLHDLLNRRQIAPHENVNVGPICNLTKVHDKPSKRGDG